MLLKLQKEQSAAEASALAAGTWEAPSLGAKWAGSQSSFFDTRALYLAQRIPFGNQLPDKHKVATLEATQRAYTLIEEENKVTENIAMTYLDWVLAERTWDTLRQYTEILQAIADVAKTRYITGQGLALDVLKAKTALAEIDIEKTVMETEVTTTLAKLRFLSGIAPEIPLQLRAVLPAEVYEITDIDAFVSPKIARSVPYMKAALAEQAAEVALLIAQNSALPTLQAKARYGNENGRLDELGFEMEVAFPLAIFEHTQIERQVEAAQRKLEAARFNTHQISREEYNLIDTLVRQLNTDAKTVKKYRATILPNTKLIVSNALAAYKTGRLSYIEIQQTLKDTLETELKYLENHQSEQKRNRRHHHPIG